MLLYPRLQKTALAFLIMLLSAVAFGQGSTIKAQTPQELLQLMIGQKLIMLHFGDTREIKLKAKDLAKINNTCYLAVQIKSVEWNKDKAEFYWENIGTPSVKGIPRGVCQATVIHNRGLIEVTNFPKEESVESFAGSVSKLFQTPEQYLAAAGISFNYPEEADVEGPVAHLDKTIIRPKPLLNVDAAFGDHVQARNFRGVVAIGFYVGTDGRVHHAHIVKSLDKDLDEQVLQVMPLWRFEPARKEGKTIPVTMNIEMSFNTY
jgi:TonB family protein